MSDKDKIREMVMALARSKSDPSQLDIARQSIADVMGAKTERVSEEIFSESDGAENIKDSDDDDDDCDDDDDDDDADASDSTVEGSLMGAAKRHARAGHRDMNAKRRVVDKASRNPVTDIK